MLSQCLQLSTCNWVTPCKHLPPLPHQPPLPPHAAYTGLASTKFVATSAARLLLGPRGGGEVGGQQLQGSPQQQALEAAAPEEEVQPQAHDEPASQVRALHHRPRRPAPSSTDSLHLDGPSEEPQLQAAEKPPALQASPLRVKDRGVCTTILWSIAHLMAEEEPSQVMAQCRRRSESFALSVLLMGCCWAAVTTEKRHHWLAVWPGASRRRNATLKSYISCGEAPPSARNLSCRRRPTSMRRRQRQAATQPPQHEFI